jgi:hypothetical protein
MKTKLPTTERKQSLEKKKLFLPLFLASIMVFSAFAVVLSGYNSGSPDPTGSIEYKDALFLPQGGGWLATLSGRQLFIRYSPLELEVVHAEADFSSLHTLLTADKTYVSVTPGENVQVPLQEFYANLKPYLPALFLACTEDGGGCEELPLKTCEDAGDGVSVLLFKEAAEGLEEDSFSLDEKEGCMVLTGTELSLTHYVDKFLLSFYGL